MKKMTNRAKQAEATKNKIYKCGIKLITKHGFDKISVEEISKAAGVSVGTYYYYFKSKFDLFREIYKRGDDYFINQVENKIQASDCLGQIVEYFDKYATFNIGNGIEMVKKLYTADNKMFITHGRAMQEILEKIIEYWQNEGALPKDEAPDEINRMLFLSARGVIYNWCLYDGKLDLNAEMEKMITLLVKGIMK